MINQLEILKKLNDVKLNIHSICSKSNCEHYKQCNKFNTVCTTDDFSKYRKIIRANGGDFELYLSLRKKLMELNYPLVINIAIKIGGSSFEDLCQEGVIGLCEVIDKFDLSRGTQFSTYAYYYIRKKIFEFIRDNTTVKQTTTISNLTKITEEAFDLITQDNPYKHNYITPKQLLKKVKQLRSVRKMKNLKISENEVASHLNRLKYEMNTYDVKSSNDLIEIESFDSFYELLCKQINTDMEDSPIGITETIKFRFGIGIYNDISELEKVSAVIGLPYSTVERNIKGFFESLK